MSLDALNKVSPELVIVLQLEGAGFITKSEARKNLKRLLPDFIFEEPVTVHPPHRGDIRRSVDWPTWTTNTPE